jgi:NAD(P)H-hydrate epimerase
MTSPVGGPEDNVFGPRSIDEVLKLAELNDCLVVGPGLGKARETVKFVRALLGAASVPVVLDADGLNCVVGALDVLGEAARRAPVIATPHPGEFARLVDMPVAEIQSDREKAAVRFAKETGVVTVLKGAETVVTDGEQVFINDTGNPGMATGGAGDVLSGMIGALLGQGLCPYESACLAVERHGLAGDIAAEAFGQLGMTAEDILEFVPEALMGEPEFPIE